MPDQAMPDVALPITAGQIRRGVEHIVEHTFPRPRQELCTPVGEMERRLASYAGDLTHAAYSDAGQKYAKLRAELEATKAKLRRVETLKCWTNEGGQRFVFVTDLQDALGVPHDVQAGTRG